MTVGLRKYIFVVQEVKNPKRINLLGSIFGGDGGSRHQTRIVLNSTLTH